MILGPGGAGEAAGESHFFAPRRYIVPVMCWAVLCGRRRLFAILPIPRVVDHGPREVFCLNPLLPDVLTHLPPPPLTLPPPQSRILIMA